MDPYTIKEGVKIIIKKTYILRVNCQNKKNIVKFMHEGDVGP